jgi:choline dehydrogenase-like flavoprotein
MYTAHYPRLHPPNFRVRTLDGDGWLIGYATLGPFFAENDRMTAVSALAGDPAYPAHERPTPPLPLGKSGADRQDDEQARLALMAMDQRARRTPSG